MHPIEPEELMAYLDGELPTGRASEAAEHLGECRDCQRAAEEMRTVSRRLLEWQVEEPALRVEREVQDAPLPGRKGPAWKRSIPWVAGVAAALVAVAMMRPGPMRQIAAVETYLSPDRDAKRLPELKMYSQLQVPNPAVRNGGQNSTFLSFARDPLIARTTEITLTAADFAKARPSLDEIVKRHGGHIGTLTIASPTDASQTLRATLRIPAAQLDAAMAEIRKLGRVETEQQGGAEVTQQVVDLEARLANARNTEQRLSDILRRSTGKISDVLAVEKEIDRVRGEIEGMEAERKNLGDRVDFATLEVRITEEYKAHLAGAAPSTAGRLRNAAVEGYRNVAEGVTGICTFLLSYGPMILLWAAVLFWPARYSWRKLRGLRRQ